MTELVTVTIDNAPIEIAFYDPNTREAQLKAIDAAEAEVGAVAAQNAAELARDQAADLVDPANIFVDVSLGTAEAAVANGVTFKLVDSGTGLAQVRQRIPSGSDLLYNEATAAALASDSGLGLLGTPEGVDAQVALLARARTAINVAALEALPTPIVGQTAILAEARRAGVFTAIAYSDAGVAALVSADTAKGIFIRSTADTDVVWRRQYSSEMDIRWFGAMDNAAIATDGAVTTGTSCHTAFAAARGVGVALDKPFTIVFQGGNYYTTVALDYASDMKVLVRGSHVFGNFSPAPGGLGHQKLTVFNMSGIEPGSPGAGTGDYYETAPVAFANGSEIPAGAQSFSAASGTASVLADGDYVALWMGPAGWHGFVTEIAQVESRAGDLVNLVEPLRYGYSNSSSGIGAFCKTFKRAKNAPGGVDSRNWSVAGWRKVVPIRNVTLECTAGGRVTNIMQPPSGYAAFAAFSWLAINVRWIGLETLGGGHWALDCQGVLIDRPKVPRKTHVQVGTEEEIEARSGNLRSILTNGSNDVTIIDPVMEDGSINFEEYVAGVRVIRPRISKGLLYIHAGTRDCVVYGGGKLGGIEISRAIQIGSGNYEFGVSNVEVRDIDAQSTGATLLYSTPTLLEAHPQIPLAMIPLVEKFFRGDQFRLKNARLVSSGQNANTMYNTQRIRCEDVEIGNDGSSDIGTPVGTAAVFGTVRQAYNGQRVGIRRYTGAMPTFYGELGDEAFKDDGTARKTVIHAFRRFNGVLAQDGSVLQIDNFTLNGSYAAGDVVRFIITDGNGTLLVLHDAATTQGSPVVTVASTTGITAGLAVTGENIPVGTLVLSVDSGTQFTMTANAEYTLGAAAGAQLVVGGRKALHESPLTSVNAGASEITLATAIPAGFIAWLSSFGAGAYIENCRWA